MSYSLTPATHQSGGHDEEEAITSKNEAVYVPEGHPTKSQHDEFRFLRESHKKVKFDQTLVLLTTIYCMLLIALFAWPRYLDSQWTGDGLLLLAQVISIVIVVGGLALIMSSITLSVTIRRWNRLRKRMRTVGLFPVASALAIMIIFEIIACIQSQEQEKTN